jgi:hypothetical protein
MQSHYKMSNLFVQQEMHWVGLMWCCTVVTSTCCTLRWSSQLPRLDTRHLSILWRPTSCFRQDSQPLESSWCKFCRDCRPSTSEPHIGKEASLRGEFLLSIAPSLILEAALLVCLPFFTVDECSAVFHNADRSHKINAYARNFKSMHSIWLLRKTVCSEWFLEKECLVMVFSCPAIFGGDSVDRMQANDEQHVGKWKASAPGRTTIHNPRLMQQSIIQLNSVCHP